MKTLNKNIFLFLLCGIFLSGEKIFAQSEFSGSRLEAAVLEYARQELGGEAEIFLSQNIQDQKFSLSDVTARLTGDAESIRTLKKVGLEFIRGEQLIKRIEIPVRIKLFAHVIKAARTITPGEIISEKDFILAKAEVSQIPEEEIISEKEILGKSLRRQITKGNIIPRSALVEAAGIKRGESIALLVQAGNVSIKTAGRALENGNIGETIRVTRDGATGTITGKVLDNGVVLIMP